MPFKSQAQRRKFAQLLVEGKISAQTFEEWNRETAGRKLPDHVRRTGRAYVCVMNDRFFGEWIYVEGPATIQSLPDAMEGLVDYYRSISGEHPDWDEYRTAMLREGKSLLRLTIERWGPIATGGFPARLAAD